MPAEAISLPRLRWSRTGQAEQGQRCLPEETPVAIVHDASTTAVMMSTPADLEDFAVGFSLTEGIIDTPNEIRSLEVVHDALGIEVRLWLEHGRGQRLAARRRRLAGPTGCGLCGVDSLAEAVRPPRRIAADATTVAAEDLLSAVDALAGRQVLGRETRAVHAAGSWTAAAGLGLVREDVGRHNALDKLAGALARAGAFRPDVVLLTSRVSVEMVQKAAVIGAPVLCAVSAPTALAVRMAEAAGITLAAVARQDGFEVFTHPGRIRV